MVIGFNKEKLMKKLALLLMFASLSSCFWERSTPPSAVIGAETDGAAEDAEADGALLRPQPAVISSRAAAVRDSSFFMVGSPAFPLRCRELR